MAKGPRIDVISPSYIGEDKIRLTVDARSRLFVNHAITLLCDYSKADQDGGACPPLVFTIQPEFGDGEGYSQRVFTQRPSFVTFIADRAGSYLCTLRERNHNRWQGRLHVLVGGERVQERRRAVPAAVSSNAADRFLSDTLLIDSDGSRMVSG